MLCRCCVDAYWREVCEASWACRQRFFGCFCLVFLLSLLGVGSFGFSFLLCLALFHWWSFGSENKALCFQSSSNCHVQTSTKYFSCLNLPCYPPSNFWKQAEKTESEKPCSKLHGGRFGLCSWWELDSNMFTSGGERGKYKMKHNILDKSVLAAVVYWLVAS